MKISDNQNWTRQRGGAKIGTLIWLFMFVAIIIVGKEAIPVKMRSSQFEDYMIEQAKFAGGRGAESLQRALLNKANELEIPVDKRPVESARPTDGSKWTPSTRSGSHSRSTSTTGTSCTTSIARSLSSSPSPGERAFGPFSGPSPPENYSPVRILGHAPSRGRASELRAFPPLRARVRCRSAARRRRPARSLWRCRIREGRT